MSTSSTSAPAAPKYPGLGLPVREYKNDGLYPSGAHGSVRGALSELLYIRELAMLEVMEKLTDKPDWHKKVFDEEIVSKWRQEALAIPDEYFLQMAIAGKGHNGTDDRYSSDAAQKVNGVLDENSFDTCIQELRSKAKYFEKTGIVPTLDASASVAKSDNLVTPELQQALRDAFDKLKADSAARPDWHPRTDEKVQDLVHPSMYPLVYGRSRVFQEECVGVEDAIEKWAGKGKVIDKETSAPVSRNWYDFGVGGGNVPPELWSETYQWLPSNVALQEDGSVRFTSYINNLHPGKYPEIYRTIESLIQTSLPMWDQCLSPGKKGGAGRCKPRMGRPRDADDDNAENWDLDKSVCANTELDEKMKEELKNEISSRGYDDSDEEVLEMKWRLIRKPVFPSHSFEDVDYTPQAGQRLAELYRETGLQIIVKLASIELTPEKPDFPVGGWHIEGQMNEHICGTALYYLDSENITPSSLSFRMQTNAFLNAEDDYQVRQDNYSWMENVYGARLGGTVSACLQNYGHVETCQGRLLAFPNVFHHRVSPFKLIDPTKPGHRRFIALWLVNPTIRIISTANVPPQQMGWYSESIFGSNSDSTKEARNKLPPELVALLDEKGALSSTGSMKFADTPMLPAELTEMVRGFYEDGKAIPMTFEEAEKHREELMKERTSIQGTTESLWQRHAYDFCEH